MIEPTEFRLPNRKTGETVTLRVTGGAGLVSLSISDDVALLLRYDDVTDLVELLEDWRAGIRELDPRTLGALSPGSTR